MEGKVRDRIRTVLEEGSASPQQIYERGLELGYSWYEDSVCMALRMMEKDRHVEHDTPFTFTLTGRKQVISKAKVASNRLQKSKPMKPTAKKRGVRKATEAKSPEHEIKHPEQTAKSPEFTGQLVYKPKRELQAEEKQKLQEYLEQETEKMKGVGLDEINRGTEKPKLTMGELIDKQLDRLSEDLEIARRTPPSIDYLEIKLKTLRRLAALMSDDIGELLIEIAEDIEIVAYHR